MPKLTISHETNNRIARIMPILVLDLFYLVKCGKNVVKCYLNTTLVTLSHSLLHETAIAMTIVAMLIVFLYLPDRH